MELEFSLGLRIWDLGLVFGFRVEDLGVDGLGLSLKGQVLCYENSAFCTMTISELLMNMIFAEVPCTLRDGQKHHIEVCIISSSTRL